MSPDRWNRDEFLVTLDLYLNQEGFIEDENDPRIKRTASLINRSPGSVALRLANYRHLDPRSTKGMENTGEHCREIWEEFYGNEEELHREAELARQRLSDESSSENIPNNEPTNVDTGEVKRTIKARKGQRDFRKVVREQYEDSCLLCDISEPGLLQASHILDWSDFEDERGNPQNGLLLCYTHHRAFDLSLFTISPNYELIVRPDLNPESSFLKNTLINRDGEKIEFPGEKPASHVLEEHNQKQVYWRSSNRS